MPRVRLVAFADSANRSALDRLRNQAAGVGIIDDVQLLSEGDLDRAFWARHGHRLRPGTRGFGYWRWKPQVIRQGLRGLAPGDVLIYLDAGCHINPGGEERLEVYVERAARSDLGLLGFQARFPEPPLVYDGRPLPEYLEAHWTKGDLLDRLDCRDKHWVTQTPQIGGGVVLMRVGSSAEGLIDDWASIMDEDPSFVDETPSRTSNLEGFVEHRHDQSILSLLSKLAGAETLSSFEYWYPSSDGRKRDWEALAAFPFHARRDLSARVTRATEDSERPDRMAVDSGRRQGIPGAPEEQ